MSEPLEENRIRLLLLDDHCLLGASLSRLLASEPGLEIAGECGTLNKALEILNGVDIVLLDFDLGSQRSRDFMLAAREAGYRGRFLIVAGAADPRSASMALKLGASGVFLKSEAPARLIHAIRLVAEGESWVDPKVIQMLVEQLVDPYPKLEDPQSIAVLEDRERSVLLGILGGLTNKKIGVKMGLSESAVKNTVQRLFGKAGVKTRSQLVRVALEGSLGAIRQVISRSKAETARRPPASNPSPARQSCG